MTILWIFDVFAGNSTTFCENSQNRRTLAESWSGRQNSAEIEKLTQNSLERLPRPGFPRAPEVPREIGRDVARVARVRVEVRGPAEDCVVGGLESAALLGVEARQPRELLKVRRIRRTC